MDDCAKIKFVSFSTDLEWMAKAKVTFNKGSITLNYTTYVQDRVRAILCGFDFVFCCEESIKFIVHELEKYQHKGVIVAAKNLVSVLDNSRYQGKPEVFQEDKDNGIVQSCDFGWEYHSRSAG